MYGDEAIRLGVPLWVSDNRSLMTVPVIRIWAYRDNPATVSDLLSQIRNTLYTDIYYMKLEYDRDYISTYQSILQDQNRETNRLRPYMVALGLSMVIAGWWNPGMVVWGADLILQAVTDRSLFDITAQGAMHAWNGLMALGGIDGIDPNYIGNFSLMHLTSDPGLDLFLQECLSEVISFGISTGARRFRSASHVLDSVESMAATGFLSRTKRWLLAYGGRGLVQELLEATEKQSARAIARRVIYKLAMEYLELVGEIVMEMGFDNMMRLNPSERPLGGGETYMALLTSYMLVRAAIDGRTELGSITEKDLTPGRRLLESVSMALFIGQLASLLPVLGATWSEGSW